MNKTNNISCRFISIFHWNDFFMLSTQPIIDEMLSAFQWNIKLTIWKANDYEKIFMPPERADLPDQIAVPHVCYGIYFLYTWLLLCCVFFNGKNVHLPFSPFFWELHFLCLIACFNSIPCSEFTGTLSKHEWRRRKFEGTFFPPKSMNRKKYECLIHPKCNFKAFSKNACVYKVNH